MYGGDGKQQPTAPSPPCILVVRLRSNCRHTQAAQPSAVASLLTLQQLQCAKTSFTAFASFAQCLVFRSHNDFSLVHSSLFRIAALPFYLL
mmetsp:Transcript_80963/g.118684  ORF Transcript_80963/g.118684 Transcript_80963/m.118684 type:complete len:91 (-) Transcript_80963:52-324(-)